MLKPKKKIMRKEIKRDPFLETIVAFREKVQLNRKLYTRAAMGAIGILILFTLYSRNQQNIETNSNVVFGKAMVFIDMGDEDNAILHLQNVIDESKSSVAGITAHYYLGRIYFDNGNYTLAGPLLEYFVDKTSNPILKGSGCQALAYVYKQQDDLVSAIELQKKAMKFSISKEDNAWASLTLAEYTLWGGNKKDARKIVKEVLIKWKDNFDLKQKAEEVNGWINMDDRL